MFSQKYSQKVLLTGDVGKAFLDADSIAGNDCELYGDLLDAVEAASGKSFDIIGVVMGGALGDLRSALKALRTANPAARIVLLAQMYEEPAAIKLLGQMSNGTAAADDYLICPAKFSHLVSDVSKLEQDRPVQVHQAVPVKEVAVDEERMRALEQMAVTDELTGLKNRRYMWEFFRQIIEREKQQKGRVTLLVFDIDNFKHYNDEYGHTAGDQILKQAASLIRRCCRPHDVVGRIGGDEFAVVFWDGPKKRQAKTEPERRAASEHPKEVVFIAKRFRREFGSAEFDLLGPEGKGVLTISGGLASYPRDGATLQELFDQADKALLEAKRSGKNSINLVGKKASDIENLGS